jgi:hypothetical protein
MVPLAPLFRLVQDDTSYCTLQEIYEKHALNTGFHKDEPVNFFLSRMKEVYSTEKISDKGVRFSILSILNRAYHLPFTIIEGRYSQLKS